MLELPTDRPYPMGGLSSKGGALPVVVPPATAAALRKLTTACGTTLFHSHARSVEGAQPFLLTALVCGSLLEDSGEEPHITLIQR